MFAGGGKECRKEGAWSGLSPVQKQELWMGLLLLSEDNPPVLRQRYSGKTIISLSWPEIASRQAAILAGDKLFSSAAGVASAQEVFLGEARRAFPRAPRSAAGRKLLLFRQLRSTSSAAPPPAESNFQIHFHVSK